MCEIKQQTRARNDLKKIWKYSFDEWDEAQADKYLRELKAGLEQLKDNPKMGRPRDDLRAGYRALRINHHIAYYKIEPGVIRIVRVLHERMDPDRHL